VAIWYGLAGPAGMPKEVIERLETAVAAMLRAPDKTLVEQFANLGVAPAPLNTPEEFSRFMAKEFEFWKELTAKVGAKAK
jgi:tripartite-type tricarboxylate transporter receptor subunit TctC